jgi:hypothetical protein
MNKKYNQWTETRFVVTCNNTTIMLNSNWERKHTFPNIYPTLGNGNMIDLQKKRQHWIKLGINFQSQCSQYPVYMRMSVHLFHVLFPSSTTSSGPWPALFIVYFFSYLKETTPWNFWPMLSLKNHFYLCPWFWRFIISTFSQIHRDIREFKCSANDIDTGKAFSYVWIKISLQYWINALG